MRECRLLTEAPPTYTYIFSFSFLRKEEKRCLCIITCHLPWPRWIFKKKSSSEMVDSHKSRAFLKLQKKERMFPWIFIHLKDFRGQKKNDTEKSVG